MAFVTEKKENFAARLGKAGERVEKAGQAAFNRQQMLEQAKRQQEQLGIQQQQLEQQREQIAFKRKEAATNRTINMMDTMFNNPKAIKYLTPQAKKYGAIAGFDPGIFDEMEAASEVDKNQMTSIISTYKTATPETLKGKSPQEKIEYYDQVLTDMKSKVAELDLPKMAQGATQMIKDIETKRANVASQLEAQAKAKTVDKGPDYTKGEEKEGVLTAETMDSYAKRYDERKELSSKIDQAANIIQNKGKETGFFKRFILGKDVAFDDADSQFLKKTATELNADDFIAAADKLGVQAMNSPEEAKMITSGAPQTKEHKAVFMYAMLQKQAELKRANAIYDRYVQFKQAGGKPEDWKSMGVESQGQAMFNNKTGKVEYLFDKPENPENYTSINEMFDQLRANTKGTAGKASPSVKSKYFGDLMAPSDTNPKGE